MGRKGESRGANLPPGARSDLQSRLIQLQRDKGWVSQVEIARGTGLSRSLVSLVFPGPGFNGGIRLSQLLCFSSGTT